MLVRVDFNVPLENGKVADDTRLRAAIPTILELMGRSAYVILMSHLGRPKGIDEALRMKPVGEALSVLLRKPVRTLDSIIGSEVEAALKAMSPGDVVLLENLRFDSGEESNDPKFAAELAALADAFVNDAFGTAHRAAASTVGVAGRLPAYAGRLLERELAELGSVVERPVKPFMIVMGGAKIGDKVGVIDALLPICDALLIGGGMANTFLAAEGVAMGDSLVEEEALETAARLQDQAGGGLVLPVDLVIADAFSADANKQIISAREGVPKGWRALDIGPETLQVFARRLRGARTVVWNGPMGVFELPPFAHGTFGLAKLIADLPDARTIVGGGDSAAAVRAAGLVEKIDWVSTGGGATLELLEGKTLPAVAALRRG